jgi:hypothetical protein
MNRFILFNMRLRMLPVDMRRPAWRSCAFGG